MSFRPTGSSTIPLSSSVGGDTTPSSNSILGFPVQHMNQYNAMVALSRDTMFARDKTESIGMPTSGAGAIDAIVKGKISDGVVTVMALSLAKIFAVMDKFTKWIGITNDWITNKVETKYIKCATVLAQVGEPGPQSSETLDYTKTFTASFKTLSASVTIERTVILTALYSSESESGQRALQTLTSKLAGMITSIGGLYWGLSLNFFKDKDVTFVNDDCAGVLCGPTAVSDLQDAILIMRKAKLSLPSAGYAFSSARVLVSSDVDLFVQNKIVSGDTVSGVFENRMASIANLFPVYSSGRSLTFIPYPDEVATSHQVVSVHLTVVPNECLKQSSFNMPDPYGKMESSVSFSHILKKIDSTNLRRMYASLLNDFKFKNFVETSPYFATDRSEDKFKPRLENFMGGFGSSDAEFINIDRIRSLFKKLHECGFVPFKAIVYGTHISTGSDAIVLIDASVIEVIQNPIEKGQDISHQHANETYTAFTRLCMKPSERFECHNLQNAVLIKRLDPNVNLSVEIDSMDESNTDQIINYIQNQIDADFSYPDKGTGTRRILILPIDADIGDLDTSFLTFSEQKKTSTHPLFPMLKYLVTRFVKDEKIQMYNTLTQFPLSWKDSQQTVYNLTGHDKCPISMYGRYTKLDTAFFASGKTEAAKTIHS